MQAAAGVIQVDDALRVEPSVLRPPPLVEGAGGAVLRMAGEESRNRGHPMNSIVFLRARARRSAILPRRSVLMDRRASGSTNIPELSAAASPYRASRHE